MTMRIFHKTIRIGGRIGKILAAVILLVILCVAVSNLFMIQTTKGQVTSNINSDEISFNNKQITTLKSNNSECIIVLGASVYSNGDPSPMLEDRLDVAIKLYEQGVAPKILLSGDNGKTEYNELKSMAEYVKKKGVPKEDIFCDYAGFSTYETAYRAKKVFDVDAAVVVTQSYHLYRAIYGCKNAGINVLGVASDQERFRGQSARDFREIIARSKDVVMWTFRPNPKYLGKVISINGQGNCIY